VVRAITGRCSGRLRRPLTSDVSRHMTPRTTSALTATLVLSGCIALPIPHDRQVTPLLAGRVIDNVTGNPVVNARVRVTAPSSASSAASSGSATAETTTDADGQFQLAAYQRAQLYTVVLLAPFEGFCTGDFTVTREGYKTVTFTEQYFFPANFNGVCVARPTSRVIRLERASGTESSKNGD